MCTFFSIYIACIFTFDLNFSISGSFSMSYEEQIVEQDLFGYLLPCLDFYLLSVAMIL